MFFKKNLDSDHTLVRKYYFEKLLEYVVTLRVQFVHCRG